MTGVCSCRYGFTGSACEYLMCQPGSSIANAYGGIPSLLPCSDHGQCLSLSKIANNNSYIDLWDSNNRIQGCACDSGYQGTACAEKSCIKGDNPSTLGVNAVQLIDCTCTTCTGGYKIIFKGKQTDMIPYQADAALVTYRLKVGLE